MQQTAKQDQSRSAGQWLSGEIESLRAKVADAESKVEQYRSKSNLFVGTNNTTLSNQQLGEFNAQVGSSRALKVDAESKARIIRETLKSGAPIEFSDIVNSELMRRLSEQRITAARSWLSNLHAASGRASPHQGAQGADCRSRSPDPPRG